MKTSGYTGIVHKDTHGTMWFDDVPVHRPEDVPRSPAWKNTRWYHTASVAPLDLSKLMEGADEAYGPEPGHPLAYKFACDDTGSYRIYDSRLWGVRSSDPMDTDNRLSYLYLEAAAAGMRVSSSAAMTAMGVYNDRYDGRDGRPKLRQLAPRWRGLSHAALHGGPIVACRGSAECVVEIDRHAAYLQALCAPVPVIDRDSGQGGYVTYEGASWKSVRSSEGFVDATVIVSRDHLGPYAIPPLPIHSPQGQLRATGVLRGAWTIQLVREAEERGEVEVTKVHQWARSLEQQPLFEALADDFSVLPRKLGKRLYTRFWGKLGSRGGFVAHKQAEGRPGQIKARGLWWDFAGITLDDPKAPRHYRPDLAAFVASHNHTHVLGALRELQPESVVAVHVDAIWTEDLVGAAALTSGDRETGSWRPQGTGPMRLYAPGIYQHRDKLAASGYDASLYGDLNVDRLEAWLSTGGPSHRMHVGLRRWSSDPAHDADAKSVSLNVEVDDRFPPTEGPSIYDSCWTPNGWMYNPDEDKES